MIVHFILQGFILCIIWYFHVWQFSQKSTSF